MTDNPASLDAILASIRARVMAPADADAGPEADPDQLTFDQVPIGDVEVTPSAASMTLDELIRSMLSPHIQNWLDNNMPEIVEKLAREEIRRLTGKL